MRRNVVDGARAPSIFRRASGAALLALAPAVSAAPGVSAAPAGNPGGDSDLTELSLEQLLDLEVTIASKQKQRLSETPAAVYVITGDEIRRSGHSSIPEALRMVPGFYVSHWTNGAWDVTSRGFGTGLSPVNQAYLNQLLVMIDGVVVYSPLFAGTWWPLQDLDLADVDRIEIIRGPGGILWGSNAVHGVVHVITKSARDTQGFRLTARGANDDAHGSMRYGAPFGADGAVRVFVKVADYDTPHAPYLDFSQEWHLNSGGFRADWTDAGHDFKVWGRAYFGTFDVQALDLDTFDSYQDVSDKKGFQIYGHMENPERRDRLQAWVTSSTQNIPTHLGGTIYTVDVEYDRGIPLGGSSDLLVGVGYRRIASELQSDDPTYLDFDQQKDVQHNLRAFAVDTTRLGADVELVLGLTLEHNSFTQFEAQPTARVGWTPADGLMTWASITRAVRTPSIEEALLGGAGSIVASSSYRSEVLWAYEVGARKRFNDAVSTDVALFYNDYDHLRYEEPGPVTVIDNAAEGEAYGLEVALDVRPAPWWSLRGAYSILHGEFEADGVDLDTDDYHPEQQINLRSYVDLGAHWELDSGIYVVDDMGPGFEIAEYTRVDARLGWHPTEALELFVGGQGLTEDTRSEYDAFDNRRRAVIFGLSWSP